MRSACSAGGAGDKINCRAEKRKEFRVFLLDGIAMQSANGSLKTKIINAMLKAAASVIKTDFIERQGEEYLERLLSDMMGLIPVNFLLPKDFDDGCFERILSEFYESEISIEVNGIMFSSKGKSIIIDEFDALKPSSDDDLEWW